MQSAVVSPPVRDSVASQESEGATSKTAGQYCVARTTVAHTVLVLLDGDLMRVCGGAVFECHIACAINGATIRCDLRRRRVLCGLAAFDGRVVMHNPISFLVFNGLTNGATRAWWDHKVFDTNEPARWCAGCIASSRTPRFGGCQLRP